MTRRIRQQALTPSEARVVRLVYGRPSIVRSELCEALGLSPGSVSQQIKSLTDSGILIDAGQAPSQGGRRPQILGIQPDLAYVIGHAVHAGELRSVALEIGGAVVRRVSRPIEAPRTVATAVFEANEDLLKSVKKTRLAGSAFSSQGIGTTAPFLFGPASLDPFLLFKGEEPRLFVPGAAALLRVADAEVLASTLCVDVSDGATGVLHTASGINHVVDLSSEAPPTWCVVANEMERYIEVASQRVGSELAGFKSGGMDWVAACCAAEIAAETTACRLADESADHVSEFLARATRMLRPERLVFALEPTVARICRPDEVRRRLRRKLPLGLQQTISVSHVETESHSRAIGAGMEMFSVWLSGLASGAE